MIIVNNHNTNTYLSHKVTQDSSSGTRIGRQLLVVSKRISNSLTYEGVYYMTDKTLTLTEMLAKSKSVSKRSNGSSASAERVTAFVLSIDNGKYKTPEDFVLGCDPDFKAGTTAEGKTKRPNRSNAIRFLQSQRGSDGKTIFRDAEISKYFGIRNQQVSSVKNRDVKSLG